MIDRLGMIWAQSLERPGRPAVIGRDAAIPWQLPEDLAHFREVTLGHPVLMGRATWESLPERFRPLPGRDNIVLTRIPGWQADGAHVVAGVAQARALIGERDAWVIGGGQVYAAFGALAARYEITEVDVDLGVPRPGDVGAPTWVSDAAARTTATPWRRSRTGVSYRFISVRRSG